MKRYFLTIGFVIGSLLINAEIIEIRSIAEVLKYVQPESCCVWDIDNTLFEPAHEKQLGSEQWFTVLIQSLQRESNFENAKHQAIQYYCTLMLSLPIKLVEEHENLTATIVEKVARTCFSLGFTARSMILGPITAYWFEHYQLLLSAQWPDRGYIIDNHEIMVYKSIIYCSGYKNAKTLFTIFDDMQYMPRHLIVVDDKIHYLQNLEKVCHDKNIPFIGLRYGYLDAKVQSYLTQAYSEQEEIE